jgi:hypothetical protein
LYSQKGNLENVNRPQHRAAERKAQQLAAKANKAKLAEQPPTDAKPLRAHYL